MKSNAALVNAYLGHMTTVLRRSPASVHRYRGKYGELLAWAGKRSLASLSTADLNEFLGRPRPRVEQASPATIAHEVGVLRSLFGHLHGDGVIGSNPSLRLVAPHVSNDDPKPAPEELWLQLWRSELTDDERVAFGLAYFCGLRRHEVCPFGENIDELRADLHRMLLATHQPVLIHSKSTASRS